MKCVYCGQSIAAGQYRVIGITATQTVAPACVYSCRACLQSHPQPRHVVETVVVVPIQMALPMMEVERPVQMALPMMEVERPVQMALPMMEVER